jgi:hypothetical protein
MGRPFIPPYDHDTILKAMALLENGILPKKIGEKIYAHVRYGDDSESSKQYRMMFALEVLSLKPAETASA